MTPETLTSPRIVRALNACIEACVDGERGYRAAAHDTYDEGLKTLFRKRAAERASFAHALREMVSSYGGVPVDHGSTRGAIHRGFLEARVATEGAASNTVVLGECERGELGALAAYDRALATIPSEAVPDDVRSLVAEQRAAIRAAYDAITAEDLGRRSARPPAH